MIAKEGVYPVDGVPHCAGCRTNRCTRVGGDVRCVQAVLENRRGARCLCCGGPFGPISGQCVSMYCPAGPKEVEVRRDSSVRQSRKCGACGIEDMLDEKGVCGNLWCPSKSKNRGCDCAFPDWVQVFAGSSPNRDVFFVVRACRVCGTTRTETMAAAKEAFNSSYGKLKSNSEYGKAVGYDSRDAAEGGYDGSEHGLEEGLEARLHAGVTVCNGEWTFHLDRRRSGVVVERYGVNDATILAASAGVTALMREILLLSGRLSREKEQREVFEQGVRLEAKGKEAMRAKRDELARELARMEAKVVEAHAMTARHVKDKAGVLRAHGEVVLELGKQKVLAEEAKALRVELEQAWEQIRALKKERERVDGPDGSDFIG